MAVKKKTRAATPEVPVDPAQRFWLGAHGAVNMRSTRKRMLDGYAKSKLENAGRPVQVHHGNSAEALTREWLSRFLPARYGVTAGFIICSALTSRDPILHYDVIIYDALNAPTLWVQEGAGGEERAIPAEHVLAVVEVKAALTKVAAKEATKKLEELRPILAHVDPPGAHYLRYPPPRFWCGVVFYELREKDASKVEILDQLLPREDVRGFMGGLILSTDGSSSEASGRIMVLRNADEKPSKGLGGSLAKHAATDSVPWSDADHISLMAVWLPDAFTMFAFDVLAMLNGTYEPGRISSWHGRLPQQSQT
jgi:hypothetical protein